MQASEYFKIERDFVRYISELGIPEQCVVTNYRTSNLEFDVVVFDLNTDNAVAFFEIKSRVRDRSTLYHRLKQAEDTRLLGAAKGYLAIPDKNERFIFFDTQALAPPSRKGTQDLAPVKLPSFHALNLLERTRTQEDKTVTKRKTVSLFSTVCVVLGLLCLGLFVLTLLKIIELSTESITIFGLAVTLFILPFVSKIKILGSEIERMPSRCKPDDRTGDD